MPLCSLSLPFTMDVVRKLSRNVTALQFQSAKFQSVLRVRCIPLCTISSQGNTYTLPLQVACIACPDNSCGTRTEGFSWLQGCSDIYDINKNVWSGKSNSFCLQKPRSHACAGVINGRIYVAGEFRLLHSRSDMFGSTPNFVKEIQ